MKLQQAKIDLSSKGTHVVSVAQEIELKDDDGKKVIGYKPDMHKSVKFDYDTILRHYTKKENYDSMNGLETNTTYYKNDLKTSTESMIDQADKSEALAAEFKDILKTFKDKDTLLKVNKLMKDKGVSIKELEMQTPEVLTELIDFAKLQLA